MSNDLVSIIVPAYGHQDYVVDCLHSLHAQTHERLELVFIDDCSPDQTFAFAESLLATPFGGRFENVILRRKEQNRGAHDSLNLGLELATGRYLAIVNSDDLFRPSRIAKLVAAMEDAGSGIAFSAVETFSAKPEESDRDGRPPVQVPEGLMLLNLRQRLNVARDLTLGFALLRQNVAISTGNFVFAADLARKVGQFQPLKYCHDWDFILQATLHTEPVFVDEVLYDYRLHPQNSFRAYQHLAGIETEVVLRRFFRAIQTGTQPNRLCPSPNNWPGYFEAFVAAAGHEPYWLAECGSARAGTRTRAVEGEGRQASTFAFLRIATST